MKKERVNLKENTQERCTKRKTYGEEKLNIRESTCVKERNVRKSKCVCMCVRERERERVRERERPLPCKNYRME